MAHERTYKQSGVHGRGMMAQMHPVFGDENGAITLTHVFVEHPWKPYEPNRLDDFYVNGGFFEAMRYIVREYGCCWERCDDRLFSF